MPFLLPIRLLSSIQAAVMVSLFLIVPALSYSAPSFPDPHPQDQRTPLHKVYHEELFSQHALTDSDSVHLLTQSHINEARSDTSIHLPFLLCGVSDSLAALESKERQIHALVGAEVVHVARALHSRGSSGDDAQHDVCLLLHTSMDNVIALTNDQWTFSPVPYLFKIHQDLLSRLSQDKPLASAVAPDLSPLSTHASSSPKTSAPTEVEGESLELVVQFFPGVNFSQEDWDALIESWSHQTRAAEAFQEHLQAQSVEHSPWEAMRHKHYTRAREESLDVSDTFDHCALPASTIVEFHPSINSAESVTVAKFLDLSGFNSPASLLCLVKLVEVLSAQPAVLSLAVQSRPKLLNYDVRGLVQSGTAGNAPLTDAGLLGQGQVVGVADSGLDDKSCFFWDNSNSYSSSYTTRNNAGGTLEANRRKVVQYTSYADGYDSAAGHGTHVVGSLVGNSISSDFSRANGAAPAAKVAFYDVQSGGQAYLSMPSLGSSMFPTLYRSGARVFSNSWGSPGADYYSDKCYDVDAYTYSNPEVLVLFAAGNSGADGTSSAFNPCTSKNALCVGSIDSRNDDDDGIFSHSRVSYFSSQGPTGDFRIKPDVVAPGFKVVSALAGGQYGGDKFCGVYETFGTSMATPSVAGGALLLRDYFLNIWSTVCAASYTYCKSFEPTGYLLKAIIIHSGQAVYSYSESAFDTKTDIASHKLGSPPDSVQGYGSVNLHTVVPLTVSERDQRDLFVSDQFGTGAGLTATLQVTVTSNSQPLKVTVLWYDRASAVGNSNSLLIINLDLVVTAPSGKKYYGNGVRGDAVNPQEQVYVSSPETGVYTVTVTNAGLYTATSALVVTCHGSVTQELTLGESTSLKTDVNIAETVTASVAAAASEPATSQTLSEAGSTTSGVLANEVAAATMPLSSSFDLVHSYTIHHTLSSNERVLLNTFELPDETLDLFSIDLSLDAHYCSGSEAFIFAVMVEAPNGEIVQLGGYNEYASLDRLWQRMSPVQWTASSAPASGGSYWRYTRYVVDLELSQKGLYSVYIELMHDSWPDSVYRGNVKLNFVDAESALDRSKGGDGGFFSSLGALGAGLLIFGLAAIVVFSVALVARKRRDLRRQEQEQSAAKWGGAKMVTTRKSKEKRKKKKSVETVEDAPWSNLSSLLSSGDDDRSSEGGGGASNDVENPVRQKSEVVGGEKDMDKKDKAMEKQTEIRHKRYKSARKKEGDH